MDGHGVRMKYHKDMMLSIFAVTGVWRATQIISPSRLDVLSATILRAFALQCGSRKIITYPIAFVYSFIKIVTAKFPERRISILKYFKFLLVDNVVWVNIKGTYLVCVYTFFRSNLFNFTSKCKTPQYSSLALPTLLLASIRRPLSSPLVQ